MVCKCFSGIDRRVLRGRCTWIGVVWPTQLGGAVPIWQAVRSIGKMRAAPEPDFPPRYHHLVISMDLITSTHNPRVKHALQLRRRKGRRQQGRIIIDGIREIQRALLGGVEPVELFVRSDMVNQETLAAIVACCQSAAVAPIYVSPTVFRQLAFGDRADGFVLVARRPDSSLERIRLGPQSVIGVLENIEKPGNVGAILRTADAAGVAAVVLADAGTDLFNPNAIRASLGAVFHVPVAEASTRDVLAWLRAHQIAIYATRVDGATPHDSIHYRAPCAIVVGNEASGLSSQWQGPGVETVKIPMRGVVDSLNVSVTAAILFYSATRSNAVYLS